MTDTRVFVRDLKPVSVPASLDELSGPNSGLVAVPHWVLWAPGVATLNVDSPGEVRRAYRAVIAEGTHEDQAALLNRELLIRYWPSLLLPRRVRQEWEMAFPMLAGAV